MEVHLAIKLVYRYSTVNKVKLTIGKLNRNILRTPTGRRQPVGYLQSMVELTVNKSKPEVITGFEPGAAACKPNALTTGPHCLPSCSLYVDTVQYSSQLPVISIEYEGNHIGETGYSRSASTSLTNILNCLG